MEKDGADVGHKKARIYRAFSLCVARRIYLYHIL